MREAAFNIEFSGRPTSALSARAGKKENCGVVVFPGCSPLACSLCFDFSEIEFGESADSLLSKRINGVQVTADLLSNLARLPKLGDLVNVVGDDEKIPVSRLIRGIVRGNGKYTTIFFKK